jgi:hypothetical protein
MTEKRLYRVFDLQRFEENDRLKKVIDAAHRRLNDRELGDDELDSVAAAGTPASPDRRKELLK